MKTPRIPAGFFVSSSGDLVRLQGDITPVRPRYAFHHQSIESGLELRATLRAGPYAWPGGYPLYLITSDCEALCFDCGHAEFRQITRAIRDKSSDGWRVIACEVNYETPDLQCAHCNRPIPSAYRED